MGLVPAVGDPDDPDYNRALGRLAAVAMHCTVFLTLLARGVDPDHAVAVTGALGLAAVELVRRLDRHDDNGGPTAGTAR